jgi:SAM-dependent methyltransferase
MTQLEPASPMRTLPLPPIALVCPACGGQLGQRGDGVSCQACAASFGRQGGFLDLIVGERFDDTGDADLLAYEEKTNRDLTQGYWVPTFRRLWPDADRPLRVLSVGCGTGVDVELLRDAGFDSFGIDCGNRVNVWPRRRHSERLLMANGKHLPFPSDTFDAVFCGCVFPHVGVVGDSNHPAHDCDRQRGELALEMTRVLRPGGRVVVSSPNRWFPFDIFHGRQPGSYQPRLNPPTSRFLLSLGDYERLFRAGGCGRAQALPVKNYWSFLRSRHSWKGYLLSLPVRSVFWLVSQPAFAVLRGSPINPWLIATMQKDKR